MTNETTTSDHLRTMSYDDLVAKAADYKRLQLEGGEGFNPYQIEIDDRARAANKDRYANREDAINRELNRISGPRAEELGLRDEARIDALKSELAEIRNAKRAAVESEWTIETTRERRRAWNELVLAGRLTGANGTIDGRAMMEQEHRQGWTHKQLVAAIDRHGIKSEQS